MTIPLFYRFIIWSGPTIQEIFEYILSQMLRESLCAFKFKHKFSLEAW